MRVALACSTMHPIFDVAVFTWAAPVSSGPPWFPAWAKMRKLSLISGNKTLLLKSPSHTARVEVFLQLFPAAKFIHIARDPRDVVRSNIGLVKMMQQLFGLQGLPPEERMGEEIVQRYIATEKCYLKARNKIPKGQLAELRLQDLPADPIGKIKPIYGELDFPFTEAFERRMLAYLQSTTGYLPNVQPPWGEEQRQRLAPMIACLMERFHLDRPTVPAVEPPKTPPGADKIRRNNARLAALAGLATAIGSAGAWLIIVHLTSDRQIWIVWPVGIAIGSSILWVARSGSWILGLWSFFDPSRPARGCSLKC